MKLENKRVLVTGGAGFLGSYVLEELAARGVGEIIVPRKKEFDLVDGASVRRLLKQSSPEVVLHLAANVGGIGANREHPAEFFYDNAMMGIQLLHESWKAGVEKFVAVGTVCSYPKFTPVPFKEKDLWSGYPEETNAPYGVAKKAILVQSEAYRQQYGFNSIYLIPVNLYGPRDNFDLETSHVIPALIRKCVTAQENGEGSIEVWGDGSPTREFLYAGDAARGIVMGAEAYDGVEPVNLGSGHEISIKDLAELIAEKTGFSGEFALNAARPNGQPRRGLDTSRAESYFQFKAEVDLPAGIEKTVEWYRAYRETAEIA